MGYYTYFEGKMDIELKEESLKEIQEFIQKEMNNGREIVLEKHTLSVDGEWKDSGLMEKVVLFIQDKGKLNEGKIVCHGEDTDDVWEILIKDNKAYLREIGNSYTWSRTYTKLPTL